MTLWPTVKSRFKTRLVFVPKPVKQCSNDLMGDAVSQQMEMLFMFNRASTDLMRKLPGYKSKSHSLSKFPFTLMFLHNDKTHRGQSKAHCHQYQAEHECSVFDETYLGIK